MSLTRKQAERLVVAVEQIAKTNEETFKYSKKLYKEAKESLTSLVAKIEKEL